MVYRAIIIDDEAAGVNTLKLFLQRYAPQIKLVGSTVSPQQGIELIENYQPDLVFLDISMPTMNGFELLEQLQYKSFKLIFTTAHEEYALKALKLKAFDYLLKPIDADDFKDCIANLEHSTTKSNEETKSNHKFSILELQVKDGIIFLKQKDIVNINASGNYSEFILENNVKHLVSKSLKEYEALLDPSIFFRCHHSHIINLYKVEKFINHEGFFAKMSSGTLIDVSRKNKDLLLERLKDL